ncbi:MAG: hypothetical protein IKO03_16135 [Lachnospiraceae bacterium]|nr:hypothetical protein [Lachnospiraceae bacterium]MBR3510288.1 hypothetical protein [Lachnospiraceae bacterium]
MKKWMRGFLMLTMLIALAACGQEDGSAEKRNTPSTSNVKDLLNGQMAENADKLKKEKAQDVQTSDAKEKETKSENQAGVSSEKKTDVSEQVKTQEAADVDLTTLSSTMVYSEVYNMMVTPDKYLGKTVKMQGSFQYFQDETTGNEYFSCLIKDATACCAQGIEFVLSGDYVYPNDYPELNAEITVYGVFDTYQEGDYMYCTLRNAQLLSPTGEPTQG